MTKTRLDHGIRAGGLLAAAILLLAGPAEAQLDDARWLPWLGCWTPVAELRQDAEAPLLCIGPAEGGVELSSVLDGEVIATELLRSDGVERPIERESCEGWERSEFSGDGHRVYLESDQLCEGDFGGGTAAIIAMVSPFEWVDVQVAGVDRAHTVNVMRYRAATQAETADAGFGEVVGQRATAIRAARIAASSPVRVDDVIEASEVSHRVAVEAWVAELAEGFDVDVDDLVRMADAGVPEGVIDMVVAVSYPEEFAIERGVRGDPSAEAVRTAERQDYRGYGPRHIYAGYGWNSIYFSPFRYGAYSSIGYGYGYPGYGYGGYGYWGYRPNIVYVRPDRRDGGGRAVSGRGYRGPRDGGTAGTARSRGGSGGGSADVSRGGGSSRGSSTGRTARRRGGGGF